MPAAGTMETPGLSKRNGEVEAPRGLNLSPPSGSVFGMLGPNGSDKTTTLSILAGLRPFARISTHRAFRWDRDASSQ
jgi:ABC-2 type transport system ATP-binding protein